MGAPLDVFGSDLLHRNESAASGTFGSAPGVGITMPFSVWQRSHDETRPYVVLPRHKE